MLEKKARSQLVHIHIYLSEVQEKKTNHLCARSHNFGLILQLLT